MLTIDGYARIDLRLTPENKLYFIEANPNPILADDEDFALAAGKSGLPYPQLIERIVRQGINDGSRLSQKAVGVTASSLRAAKVLEGHLQIRQR